MSRKKIRKPKQSSNNAGIPPLGSQGAGKIYAADIQPDKNLVINEIKLVNIDRTPKDIGRWRTAHIVAENVFYPNRSKLYDLYADVELDGHLTGIINKRVDSVLNKNIWFSKDQNHDENFDALIQSTAFRNCIKLCMESLFWGVSGMEFIPGKQFKFKKIPRKHIRPDTQQILINQADYEGIPYADNPFIWVAGEPDDLGLFLKCSFYTLIKKGDFSDWSQYAEIFGQPVMIAKYDAYDDGTRIKLQQALDERGGKLSIMIPTQAEISLLENKSTNGDGQLQERLKNACNDELSIIILGNTESTSNAHGGSNAKAQAQIKQQEILTKSDIALITNMLNSDKFLNILQSYGYKTDGGKFIIQSELNYEDLEKRVKVDTAVALQVPIDDDYWYDTYGIPKPDNYNELKKQFDLQKQFNTPLSNRRGVGGEAEELYAQAHNFFTSGEPPQGFWNKFRKTLADFFAPALPK